MKGIYLDLPPVDESACYQITAENYQTIRHAQAELLLLSALADRLARQDTSPASCLHEELALCFRYFANRLGEVTRSVEHKLSANAPDRTNVDGKIRPH